VVVLHEHIGDAKVGKLLAVVGLEEKPARVAENFWLEFPDLRQRGI
jgi:hypothetical protein